jgi:hypothetical protein
MVGVKGISVGATTLVGGAGGSVGAGVAAGWQAARTTLARIVNVAMNCHLPFILALLLKRNAFLVEFE